MRTWFINPKLMCRRHLLGEHRECHCAYEAANSGKYDVFGYTFGLVDFYHLKERHNELVIEMKNRGYKHDDSIIIEKLKNFKIPCSIPDITHNEYELSIRCKDCREKLCNRNKYLNEDKK